MEPKMQEVIRAAMESRLLEVFTKVPGIVETYDAEKETATVKIAIKHRVPARRGGYKLESIEPIQNVPVCFPQGNGHSIKWRLAPGDHVELHFTQVDHGQYRQNARESEPGDDTRHSVSYPTAHPVNTGAVKVNGTPPADTMVIEAPSKIFVGEGAQNFVALANLVSDELESIKTAMAGHTHTYTLEGAPTLTTGASSAPGTPTNPYVPGPVAASKVKAE